MKRDEKSNGRNVVLILMENINVNLKATVVMGKEIKMNKLLIKQPLFNLLFQIYCLKYLRDKRKPLVFHLDVNAIVTYSQKELACLINALKVIMFLLQFV